MKENQQPFIILEEQLFTALISGELRGKPENLSIITLYVLSCNNSEVWLDSEVLTLLSLGEPEGKSSLWRLGAGPPSLQVTFPDVLSCCKLLPLCAFGQERKTSLRQGREIPVPHSLNSVILFYTPRVHLVIFAKCQPNNYYFSIDALRTTLCAVKWKNGIRRT